MNQLIKFQTKGADIINDVKALPWDMEQELATLRRDDVTSVLKRYLAGELDRADLEVWADLIEGREDIGLERGYDDVLKDIIYELANPTIMPEFSRARAEEWVRRLRM